MRLNRVITLGAFLLIMILPAIWQGNVETARAGDLPEIRKNGVLRHLGVTYAHFVRNSKTGYDGLDVDVMKLFARHLGVKYQLVNTNWENLFTDLTGRKRNQETKKFDTVQTDDIKGDIIANGLTILPWRQEIVNYSQPTFPTGVWLIARSNSTLKPIAPSGDIELDIEKVKLLLNERSVLTLEGTCLSPELYDLDQTGAKIKYFSKHKDLNDIAPAIVNGLADATLLDIPDAMVALQEMPGEIKIIGPISKKQLMGVAVCKSSPHLLAAFNEFFHEICENGTYRTLVEKYYPSVFLYFDTFFE